MRWLRCEKLRDLVDVAKRAKRSRNVFFTVKFEEKLFDDIQSKGTRNILYSSFRVL